MVPNRHMAEEMGWVTTLNSVGLLMDDDTTRFSLNGSQQVMMWGSGEGQPTPWLKALGRVKPRILPFGFLENNISIKTYTNFLPNL